MSEKTLEKKNTNLVQKVRDWQGFRTLLPLIGLIIIIVVFAFMTDMRIIQGRSISLILSQVYVLMIACTGVFMVMTVGGLDLSQGSILGISSIVISYFSFYSIPLAVIAGVASGAFIGAFNGFFHVRFKIPSFIVTICTMYLFRGLCAYLTTNSPVAAVTGITTLNEAWFKIVMTLAVLITAALLFRFTRLGITLKAIGAGETAARFFRYSDRPDQVSGFYGCGCDHWFCGFPQCYQGWFNYRHGRESAGDTDTYCFGCWRAAYFGWRKSQILKCCGWCVNLLRS